MLFNVPVIWPRVSALVKAGTAKAARVAMIAMTTNNSIKVKAEEVFLFIRPHLLEEMGARVKLKRGPGPA